jgi:hypothetical protein
MANPDWKSNHEVIFKQATERIELAYEKAKKQGLQNPVVLVLDLRDGIARRIAGTSGRDQRIDDVVAQAESRGVAPLGIWHLPADVAAKLLAEFPDLAAKLREVPSQQAFYTVLVAEEGASLVLTPCPQST